MIPGGEDAPAEVTADESPAQPADPATKPPADAAFWMRLLQAPDDGSEGPAAFEAHGFSVSWREYYVAFGQWANTPGRANASEEDFRAHLDEELLLLRYLIDDLARRQPDFAPDSRGPLRTRLAELILDAALRENPVTPADVAAAYQARLAEFSRPEQVRVRIIRVATRDEADALMRALEAGADFAELAARHSLDEGSRTRGGELADFARGTYTPEFEQAAFDLNPGRRALANVRSGYIVIEKLAHIPPSVTPLEEVAPALRAELQRERRARFLADLRAARLATPAP
jgi:hypothetical protein